MEIFHVQQQSDLAVKKKNVTHGPWLVEFQTSGTIKEIQIQLNSLKTSQGLFIQITCLIIPQRSERICALTHTVE